MKIYGLEHADHIYVGSAHNVAKRVRSHLNSSSRGGRRRRLPVYDWLYELLEQDILPSVVRLEVTDDPDAEKRWIKQFEDSGAWVVLNCYGTKWWRKHKQQAFLHRRRLHNHFYVKLGIDQPERLTLLETCRMLQRKPHSTTAPAGSRGGTATPTPRKGGG